MKSIQALQHLSFCCASPLIVFKFILKQLIGFETMIEKICHCSCVLSGLEYVLKRKWLYLLLVRFIPDQMSRMDKGNECLAPVKCKTSFHLSL